MNTVMLARVSGVLMIGVFLINVYLGLYDTNLATFNPVHHDLNWIIAFVTLVAAALLFAMPKSLPLVALSGIVWPVVYVISLAVDVWTKLCLGGSTANCWPSHTSAFDYLILNYANIPNASGYGWKLAPVMPVAIALLFVVFVLSIVSVNALMKAKSAKPVPQPTATGGTDTTPKTSPGST
jgi:hypothetical protein